jgi:DNA-binding transcriptional ArsR family regulator
MNEVNCFNFSDCLVAMADETRQHILVLLQEREMSVTELCEQFATTQPAISHHLAILRRVKLVIARRDGKYIFYRANPACVAECCGEILHRFNLSLPIGGDEP